MQITDYTKERFTKYGVSQLYRQGNEIPATDGQMYIDRRLNVYNARRAVISRNERFTKNFPHKIADAFYYKGQIVKL